MRLPTVGGNTTGNNDPVKQSFAEKLKEFVADRSGIPSSSFVIVIDDAWC
jgi:hypothetical protein